MISRSLFFRERQDGADQHEINENYAKHLFWKVTSMKEEGKPWLFSQRDQSEENKLNRDELTPDCENYANRDVTVEEA